MKKPIIPALILFCALLLCCCGQAEKAPVTKNSESTTTAAAESAVSTTEAPSAPTKTPVEPTETPKKTVDPTVAATVYYDALPALEIDVNAESEVVSVRGKNEAGRALEAVEDFIGMTLEQAARRLTFRAAKNGYFDAEEDYLLLSFEETLPMELQTALRNGAELGFEDRDINGKVILQKLNRSQTVLARAEKYGLTVGMAQYMTRLIGRRIGENEGKPEGNTFTVEMLAPMSLREMARLARTVHVPHDYTVNFTLEQVYAFGLEDAQVDQEKTEIAAWTAYIDIDDTLQNPLDYADAVWAFGFQFDGKSYSYCYNARTGEMVYKRRGSVAMSESAAHALVEAYFLDLDETAFSVSTFSNFDVKSYLCGDRDEAYYLINAKTDEKGIYMLRVNALTQEIEVIDFHPWTTEDGRAPR